MIQQKTQFLLQICWKFTYIFVSFRATGLTVNQIAAMFEEEQADLPEISSITLIPNMDEGDDTDGDSDDKETTEPKSIDRFSAGVLNSQAEIDFVDNQDEELPDITQVHIFIVSKPF